MSIMDPRHWEEEEAAEFKEQLRAEIIRELEILSEASEINEREIEQISRIIGKVGEL